MSFNFVSCPHCEEVFQLMRLSPVGVKGRPDSNRIFCLVCERVFKTDGETWREAHGEHE